MTSKKQLDIAKLSPNSPTSNKKRTPSRSNIRNEILNLNMHADKFSKIKRRLTNNSLSGTLGSNQSFETLQQKNSTISSLQASPIKAPIKEQNQVNQIINQVQLQMNQMSLVNKEPSQSLSKSQEKTPEILPTKSIEQDLPKKEPSKQELSKQEEQQPPPPIILVTAGIEKQISNDISQVKTKQEEVVRKSMPKVQDSIDQPQQRSTPKESDVNNSKTNIKASNSRPATREKGEFTVIESSSLDRKSVNVNQVVGSEKEGFRIVISQYLSD